MPESTRRADADLGVTAAVQLEFAFEVFMSVGSTSPFHGVLL
jgi:hypothetical protein